MAGIIVLFCLNDKKLSSHMAKISKNINSSNHKIHWYYQMSKMIVDLGSNKCKNNKSSTYQLRRIQKFLLMSIVDTLEKD